jgi:hypothetical protein
MRLPRIMAGKDAPELDEVKVDVVTAEFREAFTADISEDERARCVYEIHRRVASDQEVYAAVGSALGSRFKNAIRKYVDAYRNRGRPSLIQETEQDEANLFSGR